MLSECKFYLNVVMKSQIVSLTIPEGVFSIEVDVFSESDRSILSEIYKDWRGLSSKLNNINSRSVNLPEGLSESAFCLEMGAYRVQGGISGANSSWDAFNPLTNKRIQIKACSVLPDLTSFGPSSEWDEIYFCDFYRKGNWDGSFDIYLIKNDLIYNHKVNKSQTMRDQQLQNRRPRFSIYKEIIQARNISPIKTAYLF